jgi:general stress protein 26
VKIDTFAEIESEFIGRVHTMVWCSVATIDTKNRPRSRILHPIWEIQDGRPVGWIATSRHSPKSKHLAHNPYVSLAYIANVFQPVYVDCTAQWDDHLETKQRIWELFRTTPPPLGYDPAPIFKAADDPNFGILKLTPWRIVLADMASPPPYRIWQDSAGQ